MEIKDGTITWLSDKEIGIISCVENYYLNGTDVVYCDTPPDKWVITGSCIPGI